MIQFPDFRLEDKAIFEEAGSVMIPGPLDPGPSGPSTEGPIDVVNDRPRPILVNVYHRRGKREQMRKAIKCERDG